jgi:TRAP-type C4-dicarboxylate transport system permease small subunit
MIAIPLWIPQSAMLLGLVILSIALVDELVSLFRGRTPSYAAKRREDEP